MPTNAVVPYEVHTLDVANPANQPDSIDLTSTGATKIWDGTLSGTGEVFAFRDIVVIVTDSDSATTNPVISVGTNNPNYDNLVEAYAVSLVEGRADFVSIRDPRVAAPDTDVYVNVKRSGSASSLEAIIAFGAHKYFG